MGMKIKYNRTSTISQKGERFKLDDEKYDLILFDKGVSGTVPFKEREKGKMLVEMIEKGEVETLVVECNSRLGRNTVDVLTTLRWLEEKGVNVVVRNMGNLQSHIDGKKNPIWNLITSVMSCIHELEKEQILERTEMGRRMYVMNGGKLGRKVGSNENIQSFLQKPKVRQIQSLLEKGKSVRDICGRLEVSPTTVVKVKKMNILVLS